MTGSPASGRVQRSGEANHWRGLQEFGGRGNGKEIGTGVVIIVSAGKRGEERQANRFRIG